jgi:alpha-L-fucosidase
MKTNLKRQLCLLSLMALFIYYPSQGQKGKLPVADGPFSAADGSLMNYRCPEWFRDAKFGIWAHWGPQAVPRQGDWYARRMYEQNDPAYKYHIEHYGHPSVFGYKDIIPLWKAEKWDPEKLMALYKRAGAKYFVSMGTHHDDFFLWDSRVHKWNAVNMGPHKDVVGIWQKAAKEQGLKFGVSEHLGASFTWFQAAHRSDTEGPKAGVPYDGADPKYSDLYHATAMPDDKGWLTNNLVFQIEWFNCIKELIDSYHPDLLYSDSQMPFEDVGRSLIAHFYNQDATKNSGIPSVVYTCKQSSGGKWVEDVERGVKDSLDPYPWQTDTSIGDWYYRTGQRYKDANEVVQMLVDIVSKNGNLLLNVVQTPEGDLEPDMLSILNEIGLWTASNGEGIYGTRPWKVYGESQSTRELSKRAQFDENYSFGSKDIRFTTKDGVLYAFCLGVPEGDIAIKSAGINSGLCDRPVSKVTLLGSTNRVKWSQGKESLIIRKPAKLPEWHVLGFKIEFKKQS